MKKRLKSIGIVLACILVVLGTIFLLFNPYLGRVRTKNQTLPFTQTYTKAEATEDLNAMLKKCKSIDYMFIDQAPLQLQKQYEKELAGLGETVTRLELWQAASRIFSTLKCGHHGVYTWLEEQKYYSVRYKVEKDKLYIRIENKLYEVVEINSVSANEILSNGKEMLFYENEYYKEYSICSYLTSDVTLALLTGTITEEYVVLYEDNDSIKEYHPPLYEELQEANVGVQEEFVFYEIKGKDNLAVLTLTSCKYDNHYKEVVERFFTEIKDKGITNIAVDLRFNGGGSSMVVNEFVKYLDVAEINDFDSYYRLKFLNGKNPSSKMKGGTQKDLLYQGDVYVLTSTQTFSSAMQFAVLLQDNGLAEVIGEPCGNKPSQYGEVATFCMPNSKLYYTCTVSYFERPNKAVRDAEYPVPDYWVDANIAMEKLEQIINEK